jgi:hypothetical protein
VCAVAAAQLARQQRQMDVVEKAVELLADSPLSDFKLTTEQAATVVQKEKKERAFPTPYRPGPDYSEFFEDGLCDCPDCRRARGEAVSPFEEFDDEDDDDFDEIFNELPPLPGVPPDVAKILAQEMVQAIQRGESFDSMLNRVLGPGFGGKRKKGRQR